MKVYVIFSIRFLIVMLFYQLKLSSVNCRGWIRTSETIGVRFRV